MHIGDDYAISGFKNHWEGYISPEDIQTISTFGITHVRIPIGYWIVESPVYSNGTAIPGTTMYDYGFSYEGFVTGGMNSLEHMIQLLKQYNIKAILDLHAVPGGGSSCQSYSGIQISDANASFWYGSPPVDSNTPIAAACSGAGP